MSYRTKIVNLLEKNNFDHVVFTGAVRKLGKKEVLFYDAEFFDRNENTYFVPREFRGKANKDMNRIVSLLTKMKKGVGTVVAVPTEE